MKSLGKVVKLFIAKSDEKKRILQESLSLIENFGIKGDKFARKNVNQAVMMVGTCSYELAKSHNILLEFGDLGENILVDFNTNLLKCGQILYIENLILEVTQSCSVCKHLAKFDAKLPKIMQSNRGIYLKILQTADIKTNMIIKETL